MFCAGDADDVFRDPLAGVSPCVEDVVDDRGDGAVVHGCLVRRHGEVVRFPGDFDRAFQTFQNDGCRAFRVSLQPLTAGEGWENAVVCAFSVSAMAGGATESVELFTILGAERTREREGE